MVRVLVVEDDARLNQIVCASLRAAGYEAIGCANAAQARLRIRGEIEGAHARSSAKAKAPPSRKKTQRLRFMARKEE